MLYHLPKRVLFLAGIFVLGLLLLLPLKQGSVSAKPRNAVPFAIASPPIEKLCDYSLVGIDRATLLPDGGSFNAAYLDVATACHVKVIVRLHGLSSDISNPAPQGGLNLTAYEDRINDFAGLINPYVANGTVVAHLTIDEPHDCVDWSDVCPAPATVDQAATISKNYWPTLPTIVNTLPVYASTYTWVATDELAFTYAFHKGPLPSFISNALTILNTGKARSISWALQVEGGGCEVYNVCSMTPAQVLSTGSAMCDTGTGNKVLFARYTSELLTAEMRQAITDLRNYCGDPAGPTPTPFVVTGKVYGDLDADRFFDTDDYPLSGVTVSLTSVENGSVFTAVSTADGSYNVTNLAAGTYTADVLDNTLPPGYAYLLTGSVTAGLTVTATYDFPVAVNHLGGLVYRDNNGNATYEPSTDTVYPNVTVRITGLQGNVLTTTTNSQGVYAWRGLAANTYTISIDSATIDPNWLANPTTRSREVVDTTIANTQDFAIQPPLGSVSGIVFVDFNSNNVYDAASENLLAGAVVRLTSVSSNTTLTTTSATNGSYSFTNLPGGSYNITLDGTSLPGGHAYSSITTITVGQTSAGTFDFPVRVNSITGLVYRDFNVNALYDPQVDVPYVDAVVKLIGSNGNVVATATVIHDGTYTFRAIADGTYTLSVDPATLDSNWLSIPATRSRTVVNTSAFTAQDFAIQPPSGTINGFVFADLNSNNLYDVVTENTIANVVVTLTDSASGTVRTATSDATGDYSFTNVPAGTYTITLNSATLPVGHAYTTTTTINLGQTGSGTLNFPVRVNSLSGLVFRDNNSNAVYNAGIDTPYQGVVVRLANSGGTVVATATTDAAGLYTFRAMATATYTISVDPATIDANWLSNPVSRTRAIVNTSVVTAQDFAIQPPSGSLSGLVFKDLNANNVYDVASETPLASVVVNLTSQADGTLRTATSNASGNYSFTGLPAGSYTLTLNGATLPPGHAYTASTTITITQTGSGTFNFPVRVNTITGLAYRDNNFNALFDAGDTAYPNVGIRLADSNGVTQYTATTNNSGIYTLRGVADGTFTITVDPATVDSGWLSVPTNRVRTVTNTSNLTAQDFALQPPGGTISGIVYADYNANLVFDATDAKLQNVTITLTNASGTTYSAITNITGDYAFTNLAVGTYTIALNGATLPAGHTNVAGGNVTVTQTGSVTYNFPVQVNGLFGLTYRDNDSNGTYNPPTDTVYAAVTLQLMDSNGTVIRTTTSDSNGQYAFRGLADGIYTWSVDPASIDAGWTSVPTSRSRTVAPTSNLTAQDFALQPPIGGISGNAYLDLDGDGRFDVGEGGVNSVQITLQRPDGSTTTATTDAAGHYAFNGLSNGSYVVRLNAATLPAGHYTNTGTLSVSIVNGVGNNTSHFAIYRNSVSGMVFRDGNRNRRYNNGIDTPLANIVLKLTPSSGTPITTTTNASGNYTFLGIAPGNYTLSVDAASLPTGNYSVIASTNLVIATSSQIRNKTFPIWTNDIGGSVYTDIDRDRIYDQPGDTPLQNIRVNLSMPDGTTRTTTTANDGTYRFLSLAPGSYTVTIDPATLPVGSTQWKASNSVTVTDGTYRLTFDFWVWQ